MAVDVKKWLADKAQELGLDESGIATVEKALSSNTFKGDFVALPDFHSALDKQKTRHQQELDEVVNLNAQWQEEFDKTYKPALAAVDKLKKAGYDMTGFEDDGRGGVQGDKGQTFTIDDVKQLIAQAVEPVRAGAIDYGTFIADKAVEYRETYSKRFNTSEFRKYAYEHRQEFPTLDSAYMAYTEADRKKKDEADKEAWKAAEREKILLEVRSSTDLPEAAGSEGSPLYIANEQKEDVSRDATRQAFAKQFADKSAEFAKIS